MHIKRDFQATLQALLDLYPVALVTGPRQTGKTALVRHLAPSHRYVLLDEHSVASQATEDPGLFVQNYPPPVIFDEIQKAPGLLREIKAWVDRGLAPKGSIILTGSQPLPLMKGVAESLAGRVGILDLPPMSPAEIFGARGRPRWLLDWLERPPVGEDFPFAYSPVECLVRGGFPAMALAVHSPLAADASQRLGDYVQTYLSRDLRDLAQVHDLGKFARFMRQTSVYSGRIAEVSEIAANASIPQSTADQWVGLLEASMLLLRVPGYAKKFGRRERKRPRFFLCDPGLQANLLGYTAESQVMASPLLGNLFETAGAAAVRKLARGTGGVLPIYHWRLDEKAEVDLVVELTHDELCLIELKFSSTPHSDDIEGIAAFRAAYGQKHRAILVSTNPRCFWLTRDVLHVPWSAL